MTQANEFHDYAGCCGTFVRQTSIMPTKKPSGDIPDGDGRRCLLERRQLVQRDEVIALVDAL